MSETGQGRDDEQAVDGKKDIEEAGTKGLHDKVKPSTDKMVLKQWVWVLFFFGVAPTAVCFGINYGLLTLSFLVGETAPPKVWEFPSPLAGAYALILIITTACNFLISGTLQTLDIKNGKIPPLSPNSRLSRWYPARRPFPYPEWWLRPPDFVMMWGDDSENENPKWYWRLFRTALRTFAWVLLTFCLLWPPATGLTYGIWGDSDYNQSPQPELMGSILAAILCIITCPVWAVCTLVSYGRLVA